MSLTMKLGIFLQCIAGLVQIVNGAWMIYHQMPNFPVIFGAFMVSTIGIIVTFQGVGKK